VSPTRRLIIAIDGPAGAGKSTLAARIAARYGLLNLETGAMYRAFALKALENRIPLDDAEALSRLAASTTIRLEPGEGGNRVYLDGVDVTERVREPNVTEAASQVSVHPAIREWMVALQRELGREGGVVMEGRDIGTAVFPDAEVKIFLDAAPEVRGQRRYQQSGSPETTAPEAVLQEIRERDRRDRTRAQSPLRAAPDAVVIDSTHMTLDEVVARMEALVTERMSLR
jgi:cytidylate kinase